MAASVHSPVVLRVELLSRQSTKTSAGTSGPCQRYTEKVTEARHLGGRQKHDTCVQVRIVHASVRIQSG